MQPQEEQEAVNVILWNAVHVHEQPFRYRYLDWKSKMYSNHITLNGFTGKKNSPDQMTMQQALQHNPLLLQYQLVSYQTKEKRSIK